MEQQTLRAIGDSILFVFLDDVNEKGFTNKTETGIIFKSMSDSTSSARWGKVLATGPRVENIEVDMEVLIEPLRWTEGIEFNGHKVWRTIEKEIIAIREE
jgi:hypothetical protein